MPLSVWSKSSATSAMLARFTPSNAASGIRTGSSGARPVKRGMSKNSSPNSPWGKRSAGSSACTGTTALLPWRSVNRTEKAWDAPAALSGDSGSTAVRTLTASKSSRLSTPGGSSKRKDPPGASQLTTAWAG